MTSAASGSLMTPLLVMFGGINPVVAIGTDLAYGAITKTVGGWRHLRQGTVDLRLSWWLAAGSVPGPFMKCGSWPVSFLPRMQQRWNCWQPFLASSWGWAYLP